jgi:hypothetical protein
VRKHQQKQILELIQTLREAQSAGLYADAQCGAFAAGRFIEQIEGAGARAADLLARYRELLSKAMEGEAGAEALERRLAEVEDSVRRELRPNKIEIVFIAYNASMSDSVLSIYLAAKSDPDCDAVWLPVPYFARNSDGRFGEMRCDGAECYGGDVECADWRQYDIEARRPDVIVTFSPYDAGNYVTSVHPDFYCERLRGLTDLLVYCPYFVVIDDVQEHFCTVAGCVFAHKVILQSERVRSTYIRVFKEAFGDRFGRPEDKFVALGSPKYDAAAAAARRGAPALPCEWRALARGRKLVFYNTSVGAMLEGGRQYLKKLRSVLETFKGRGGVALLWRPHPLSEQTYDSMRPELAAEYRSIVADYRREGWGIYDDSPDLHRAIAASDAYYGDMSSVAALFMAHGKDVLIQNLSCAVDSRSFDRVRFLDFWDDGGGVWFASFDSNCLCRFDKADKATRLVKTLPGHEAGEGFRSVCRVGGKLLIAPVFAEDVLAYDIARDQLQTVPLAPMPAFRSRPAPGAAKFAAACRVGRHVFFIPLAYGTLVRYDAETGSLEYFDDYIPALSALAFRDGAYWFSHGVAAGESIYMAAGCANAVVEFNTATCKSTVFSLGGGRVSYKYVCFDGAALWLMHDDGGAVSVWDKRRGIIRTLALSNTSLHSSLHSPLHSPGGAVVRVPCGGELSFEIIDPGNGYSVTRIKPDIPHSGRSGLEAVWPDSDAALCCKESGGRLYVYSATFDNVYVFDMNGRLVDGFSTEIGPADAALLNAHHGELIEGLAGGAQNALCRAEDFFGLKLTFYIEYVIRRPGRAAVPGGPSCGEAALPSPGRAAVPGGPSCGEAILSSLKRCAL